MVQGMRFKEYINEIRSIHGDVPAQSSFDLEKFTKDCAPFLLALKGSKFLAWHGTIAAPAEWELITLHAVRAPRDTPRNFHNSVDNILESKFGWRARSSSIFTNGSTLVADSYGEPCAVFPVGKFKSLWSPDVSDLTALYGKMGAFDALKFLDNKCEWHFNSELQQGLAKKNEVLIGAEKCYLININGDTYQKILQPWLAKNGIIT